MNVLFKTKYQRPLKLSDPHFDFMENTLKSILRKKDENFIWSDYIDLFGPHLPAGTYEEVIYFLPQAFSYLKANENDALDLVTPIFGFCSKNINNLKLDGLLDIVKLQIVECLNQWINDFRIIHFDKDGCLKKEWGLNYFDYVCNSAVVCEGTTDLVRFETLGDIAVTFVESLAYHQGNIVKALWFLEYSKSRFDVYTPPNCDKITELLTSKELLNSAYDTVWEKVMEEHMSPTYWRDTFNKLEI